MKSAKVTKFQQHLADSIKKAQEKAVAKELERQAALEAHKAMLEEAKKAAGAAAAESDSEWENDTYVDPRAKDTKVSKTLERKAARAAKHVE